MDCMFDQGDTEGILLFVEECVYRAWADGTTQPNLYNVDETSMRLDHRPPKVVTKKGQKKVRSGTSGNKSQFTVTGC